MKELDSTYALRAIRAEDDVAIEAVVRQVLSEYQLNREGFAYVDSELSSMHGNYVPPQASYYVLTRGEAIVGGGGFAPLLGGDPITAELKKMYFLPEARGLGWGRRLMELLLEGALRAGYQQIYLETTPDMQDAIALYEKSGFQKLNRPLGATGHFGCQVWMLRHLR